MSLASVQKWGNSMALRIPSATIKAWGVREGDSIELTVQDDTLLAKPKRKRYTLDELLAKCDKKNMAPTEEDRLWLDSPPMGKEIL